MKGKSVLGLIFIFASAVAGFLMSPVTARAQQRAATPQMFKHAGPQNRTFHPTQNSLMTPRIAASAMTGQDHKIYDLGHYPGGSWAQLGAINDFGVAVGYGDVAGGDTRMLGVPLFGPNAGHWFDSGVSSDDGVFGEGGVITLFGLIVGHIRGDNGYPRAYAWTANHQTTFDLGTLPGDDGSGAIGVNHLGTLIVGVSLRLLTDDPDGLTKWLTPVVVWKPKFESRNGQQSLTWEIQALPMGARRTKNA